MYRTISMVLRWGLHVSLATMVVGLGLLILAPEPVAFQPLRFREILAGVLRLQAVAWLDLGVLILLVTPVLRVVTTLISFSATREWMFAGVSAFVLAVFFASFVLALR